MMRLRLAPLLLFLAGVAFMGPQTAHAQAPQPTWMTISPISIPQQGCYTITVGNGANMTLDIYYSFGGGGGEIPDWPVLDSNGQAEICTDQFTPIGTYVFNYMRNSQNSTWVALCTPFCPQVHVTQPIPQPTGMSFDAPAGWAGNSTYTLTVANGASMSVDLLYTLNGNWYEGTITTDSNGQFSYALEHGIWTGGFVFYAIKNSQSPDWVDLNPYAYYTIYPPHPTGLTFNPTSVSAGQGSYGMYVGNGGGISLDVNYAINGVSKPTIYNWPYLAPTYSGSPAGYASVNVGPCTTTGNYMFTQIRNTANGDNHPWLNGGAAFQINPPSAPSVSSISVSSAARNSVVSVTITGNQLCGVSLNANGWQGLSFSSIPDVPSSDGHSVTANVYVDSNAWTGVATVTLNARGGSTTFTFTVLNNAAPVITSITPNTGTKGSSVPVTIAGSNLGGSWLTATPAGALDFTNLAPNPAGTSMTATFTIPGSATAGTVQVKASTSLGDSANLPFVITQPSQPPTLTREYIYLGDRVIAVDSP
jgi:hypothetical protein